MGMKENYDVIVVGAGPAGGECARHLSENSKLSVLLLDKTNELGQPKKSTAGAMNETLLEFGLPERVSLWKVDSLVFKGKTKVGKVPVDGHVLDFAYLKAFLAKTAIKNGVDFRLGAVVEGPVIEEGRVVGVDYTNVFGEKLSASAKIVVDASGPAAVIATKTGIRHLDHANHAVGVEFEMENLELEYPKSLVLCFDQEKTPGGYTWVFPTGAREGRVGVCWMVDPFMKNTKFHETPMQHLKGMIETDERLRKATAVELHGGDAYSDSSQRKVSDGLIVAGDAVSALEPIVGEGIREALRSGRLAAGTAISAFAKSDFSAKFLSEYERKLHEIQKDRALREKINKIWPSLPNVVVDNIMGNMGKLSPEEVSRLLGFNIGLNELLRLGVSL